MKTQTVLCKLVLPLLLGTSLLAGLAQAQVRINITIAPPAPQYEVVPQMAPAYVWAPGYWAWHGDRYIWMRGRSIVQRPGYFWEPDRWEERNAAYYRYPGAWRVENESGNPHQKKEKKPKKSKHGKEDGDRD